MDGLRVDTLMYAPAPFWAAFTAAAGVYAVGEVTGGVGCEVDYVRQGAAHATLDYPGAGTLREVFGAGGSMLGLDRIVDDRRRFPAHGALQGTFLDNHDMPRFLGAYPARTQPLRGALAWLYLAGGIPVVYYGTEQALAGGADPLNRQPLWTTGYPTRGPLYRFLAALGALRRRLRPWEASFTRVWAGPTLYAFLRGGALVVLTNQPRGAHRTLEGLPFPNGTRLCDEAGDSGCVTVQGGAAFVSLPNGAPAVLCG